ncbi:MULTISPECIES: head GIN domain-containing protein [Sphingomonadales]|uniref:DUF2807 domain-containing protein n=2 Tax=Edaphosphingomonas TaxID=3423724 RepID=A0A2T4I4D7_9SPHN|nr:MULTISPECIES: head GIN domain-containing protein [Sphingomonas]AGH50539.1 hypothetical protein G432_14100 [Sphingomonas sp. MM-1]MDX3883722.1 head GIN domain-containing protein [Sphingomonas sp.]OHT18969.1 hypothetical protein BHE75_00949 [Sphingomonas haloaromaticamans]PTD24258.1 DUF2807 domain-containing protein [Sphingomonas fennica]
MRLALIALPAALLAACNAGGPAAADNGGGGRDVRQFSAAGFDRVALRGPDDVTVRVGPAVSVRAEGDRAVLDRLEVSVVDGELRLARRKEGWNSNTRGSARFIVTLPALRGATVAGSGNMSVDHAKAREFAASIAGSGNLGVGAVEGETVDLSVNGSGNLTVAGSTRTVSGSINGSGSIRGQGLKADTASISIAGSGDADLTARSTAAISVIGSGNATVTGGAKCTIRRVGSGGANCS